MYQVYRVKLDAPVSPLLRGRLFYVTEDVTGDQVAGSVVYWRWQIPLHVEVRHLERMPPDVEAAVRYYLLGRTLDNKNQQRLVRAADKLDRILTPKTSDGITFRIGYAGAWLEEMQDLAALHQRLANFYGKNVPFPPATAFQPWWEDLLGRIAEYNRVEAKTLGLSPA